MSRYQIIWNTVRKIPCGRVATYGQIADLSGMDGHARLVGYAMHALPDGTDVPWHRVLGASGRVSLGGPAGRRQRSLLEQEGVRFKPSGKIDLQLYRWKPRRKPGAFL